MSVPPPGSNGDLGVGALGGRAATKRFGYAFDPVCVVACTCYAVNRWLLPAAMRGPFMRNYFSDVLLIPAALPLVLWLHRRLGLRANDLRPSWSEIFLHWAVWSIAAEVVAPHFFPQAVGDPWDVAAYASGAVVSGLIWHLG